jgi:hypothetical protein
LLDCWFRAKSPRRGDELKWWQQLNVDPAQRMRQLTETRKLQAQLPRCITPEREPVRAILGVADLIAPVESN